MCTVIFFLNGQVRGLVQSVRNGNFYSRDQGKKKAKAQMAGRQLNLVVLLFCMMATLNLVVSLPLHNIRDKTSNARVISHHSRLSSKPNQHLARFDDEQQQQGKVKTHISDALPDQPSSFSSVAMEGAGNAPAKLRKWVPNPSSTLDLEAGDDEKLINERCKKLQSCEACEQDPEGECDWVDSE
jgi:hypothetical protein